MLVVTKKQTLVGRLVLENANKEGTRSYFFLCYSTRRSSQFLARKWISSTPSRRCLWARRHDLPQAQELIGRPARPLIKLGLDTSRCRST